MSISQLLDPQAGGLNLATGLLGLGNQSGQSAQCAPACQAPAVQDGVSMQSLPQGVQHHHGHHHHGGGQQMQSH